MRYKFIIKSQKWHQMQYFGGAHTDPAKVDYLLTSEPRIREICSEQDSYHLCLRLARWYCRRHGGVIILLDPTGAPTKAWEWRDAGELDPESHSKYYETAVDPAAFRHQF